MDKLLIDKSLIGERIRALRQKRGMSSGQLSKACGISTGNISALENGQTLPSSKALIALSSALDCSTDWILTGRSSVSELLTSEENELFELFREVGPCDREEILALLKLKVKNHIINREDGK